MKKDNVVVEKAFIFEGIYFFIFIFFYHEKNKDAKQNII